MLEEIKNDHVVSAMFGAPLEAIFTNPYVIIFTNQDISNYLSFDRWEAYEIQSGDLLKIKKTVNYSAHDLNSRYIKLYGKETKC